MAVAAGVDRFRAGNDDLAVTVDTAIDPGDGRTDLWVSPIESVSNSEAGFELVYQGSASLVGRVIHVPPGGSASIGIRHLVTVSAGRTLATTPAT
jgi:hypothetical protein